MIDTTLFGIFAITALAAAVIVFYMAVYLWRLGDPKPRKIVVHTLQEGLLAARELGYPVKVSPWYTLGASGTSTAHDHASLEDLVLAGLHLSPVGAVTLEQILTK